MDCFNVQTVNISLQKLEIACIRFNRNNLRVGNGKGIENRCGANIRARVDDKWYFVCSNLTFLKALYLPRAAQSTKAILCSSKNLIHNNLVSSPTPKPKFSWLAIADLDLGSVILRRARLSITGCSNGHAIIPSDRNEASKTPSV